MRNVYADNERDVLPKHFVNPGTCWTQRLIVFFAAAEPIMPAIGLAPHHEENISAMVNRFAAATSCILELCSDP